MKTKILLIIGLVAIGFVLKLFVVEAERIIGTHYIDSCLEQYSEPTQAEETDCYSEAKKHIPYKIIYIVNFQPNFWKNTNGRCVETNGEKSHEYFECKWWNEIAL